MIENWTMRKRPVCLVRRFEFSDYEQTREFLDRVAELAEREDYYPDMNFGRTHVSMTLYPQDEGDEINEAMKQYVHQIDALLPLSQETDKPTD